MKKILIVGLLSIILAACQPTTPPVVETPMTVPPETPTAPAPETPLVTTPTPTTPSASETPITSETCVPDCTDACAMNSNKVCGQGTNYYDCVENCGTFLRPEGCKASCNTEATKECEIVFRSECKRDCTKSCA